LNLASILIKKILVDSDVSTWGAFYRHYLPKEYHRLHDFIAKHVELYNELPTFDDLKLSVRDSSIKQQLYSIEISEEVDVACDQLLDYIKNEYAQIESMNLIEKFLDNSVSMSTAEEIIDAIQDIVLQLEDKIDILEQDEDMGRISLFDNEEMRERSVPLGLNNEYDEMVSYAPGDLVMFGGKRGQGKSVTCANIVAEAYKNGNSSIYFTIEMSSRSILQRICAISTGIPAKAIMHRNLSVGEWETVAEWWSRRFEGGEKDYYDYLQHRSFDSLHTSLIAKPLRDTQLDVIHDPSLSIGKIRTELDKKIKTLNPSVVVVDYINQVERHGRPSKLGQYDWSEQIEISKSLKNMAQTYGVMFVTPYQIDATGEARFAKGILDAPDAAFTLDTHSKENGIIEFKCTKMRNGPETGFVSQIDWATLKIGPESGFLPGSGEPEGEEVNEI
jgi:replicative DNA helicase